MFRCTTILFLLSPLMGQSISVHPDPGKSAHQRWDWALARADATGASHGFWVAYGLDIETDSYYLSSHQISMHDSVIRFGGSPLNQRIEALSSVRHRGAVAVLFFFDGYAASEPSSTALTQVSMPFSQEDHHLFWLGNLEEGESFAFLESLYRKASGPKLKTRVLSLMGVHSSSDVVPFMVKLARSEGHNKLRTAALRVLGNHPVDAAVNFLEEILEGDDSWRVRQRAVAALGKMDHARAEAILMRVALGNEPRKLRMIAIGKLGNKQSPKAVSTLADLVERDPDPELRETALKALGKKEDDIRNQHLIRFAATHPQKQTRGHAIKCLGRVQTPQARAFLLKQVTQVENPHLEISVKALARHRGEDVEAKLIELAKSDAPKPVRKQAIAWLKQHETDRALRTLQKLVRSEPDTDLAKSALKGIANRRDGLAETYLLEQVEKHSNGELRAKAAEALKNYPHERVFLRAGQLVKVETQPKPAMKLLDLLEHLEPIRAINLFEDVGRHHAHWKVRARALKYLARHRGPESLPQLRNLLKNEPEAKVRRAIVKLMGKLDGPKVVPALVAAARRQEDPGVQKEAIKALATKPSQKILKPLQQLAVSDPDPKIREAALKAIVKIPGGEGIPFVMETAKSDPSFRMRKKAIKMLASTGDPRVKPFLADMVKLD